LQCTEVDECSGMGYLKVFPGGTYKESKFINIIDDIKITIKYDAEFEDWDFKKKK
jgi:hypothetical protein